MQLETINNFAIILNQILQSDRDCVIAVAGFTGEGKSCFTSNLAKEYSIIANTYWDFDRMTWLRKEMMTWIDGEGVNKTGQLPEYSVIVPDELFTMFYKRQWYETEQINSISTFNMCRDRHLLVIGNVPNFWDLDSGFTNRIRFYVYIPKRGVAWIFEQENNPFTKDPWNVDENKKLFRKNKNPYKCPNFLFEVHYNDWSEDEKKRYYEIRNSKRIDALQNNKDDRVEKYSRIKKNRDKGIFYMIDNCYIKKGDKFIKCDQSKVADVFGVSGAYVSNLYNGNYNLKDEK